jgi:septal ring factor EnvC (AmiA/AmiB activator)
MDNEKIFELLEKFYGEFNRFQNETKAELNETKAGLNETKAGLNETKAGLAELKNITTKIELAIETDINPKIQALLDGHVNHSEQLSRIEKEITRQDEIIMRRIK